MYPTLLPCFLCFLFIIVELLTRTSAKPVTSTTTTAVAPTRDSTPNLDNTVLFVDRGLGYGAQNFALMVAKIEWNLVLMIIGNICKQFVEASVAARAR